MKLNSYINKFGKLSFKEYPFNDVDALVFAEASYIDYQKSNYVEGVMPLTKFDKDLNYKEVFVVSVDSALNRRMINFMQKSKRYKSVKFGEIHSVFDRKQRIQFYAVTFFLPNNTLVVSFRGTDNTVVGWLEDITMCYETDIFSQREAKKYLKMILDKYPNHKYYVAGHSKGGNLAFYSVLEIQKEYLERLEYAYSFDGPGFVKKVEDFSNFALVKDKLRKYKTQNDVIGNVLNDIPATHIVRATGWLFGGHDPFTWEIKYNGEFSLVPDISSSSKRFRSRLAGFIDESTIEQRKMYGDVLEKLLEGKNTVYEVLSIVPVIGQQTRKVVKEFPEEVQEKMHELYLIFKKFFLKPQKKK